MVSILFLDGFSMVSLWFSIVYLCLICVFCFKGFFMVHARFLVRVLDGFSMLDLIYLWFRDGFATVSSWCLCGFSVVSL